LGSERRAAGRQRPSGGETVRSVIGRCWPVKWQGSGSRNMRAQGLAPQVRGSALARQSNGEARLKVARVRGCRAATRPRHGSGKAKAGSKPKQGDGETKG